MKKNEEWVIYYDNAPEVHIHETTSRNKCLVWLRANKLMRSWKKGTVTIAKFLN